MIHYFLQRRKAIGPLGNTTYVMKSSLIFGLSGLVVGIVVGVGSAWLYWDRASIAAAKNWTLLATEEHIQHANLLREGKSDEVLQRLDNTLPIAVLWLGSYHELLPEDEDFLRYLWRIREYYELHGLEIPPAAREQLMSLAPKPPRSQSSFQCPRPQKVDAGDVESREQP